MDMKTGYCFGCGRTRDEISGWMAYTNDERSKIINGLEARMETIEQKPRRETRRKRMAREKAESNS